MAADKNRDPVPGADADDARLEADANASGAADAEASIGSEDAQDVAREAGADAPPVTEADLEDEPEPAPKPDVRSDVKWTSVLLLTVLLSLSVWPYWPTGEDLWARGPSDQWLAGSEDFGGMVAHMLGDGSSGLTYVVAFELLGILLVVALVGAIAIALREGGEGRA